MKKSDDLFTYITAACGLLASCGDFIVTFILGALFPGYNSIHHSESYLGTSQSPVAFYMNAWGIVFFVLFLIYSIGLRKFLFIQGKWQLTVVICVALYGLGEGLGSGLFPYNHVNKVLTLSGELHSFFGAMGGIALAIIPLGCYKIFHRESYLKLNRYSLIVFIAGIILVIPFLLSESGIISYRGLLQRVYILNYHAFFSVIALVMIRNTMKD
jgi:hypothetical protein